MGLKWTLLEHLYQQHVAEVVLYTCFTIVLYCQRLDCQRLQMALQTAVGVYECSSACCTGKTKHHHAKKNIPQVSFIHFYKLKKTKQQLMFE